MSERESYKQRVGTDDILIAAATYAACIIMAVAVLSSIPSEALGPAGRLLTGLGAAALAALAAVVVCLRCSSAASLDSMGLRAAGRRWMLLGVAGGLLLPVLSVILIALYLSTTGAALPDRGLPATPTRTAAEGVRAAISLVVLGGLLAPIVEELLFRGLLYTYLRRWGAAVAVIASTVAFALPHGGFLPIYIAGGLIFALLYEYSGSIWPAMIAHVINNTFWFGSLALASIFLF